MAERHYVYNTDDNWKNWYAADVKNKLYLTMFGQVIHTKHFKEKVRKRNIRIPTVKTLLYGKVIAVAFRKGTINRAIISVVAGEKYERRFVVAFKDRDLIFVTTFLREREE